MSKLLLIINLLIAISCVFFIVSGTSDKNYFLSILIGSAILPVLSIGKKYSISEKEPYLVILFGILLLISISKKEVFINHKYGTFFYTLAGLYFGGALVYIRHVFRQTLPNGGLDR